MSAFIEAKQAQAGALSLLVAQRVRNFFKIEKNRTEFEAWYRAKTGKEYDWKKVTTCYVGDHLACWGL